MWDAIASNERRSWLLVGLMGVVLIALGGTIGLVIDPQVGGYFGVAAAVALWLILWATAAGAGDSILLSSAKAREIRKEDAPPLWNVVEEMTIASGLGQMPKIYVIDDPTLNAFAVGYRPQKAAVAVTSGLLKRLTRDELQGVIGHELGHIRNLDVRFMTLASVMVGAVVLISQGFLRGMFYSGGRRGSSRGGGQAQLILMVVAIVLAIVAPLAAQVLYFACSRRRELLADASSARFTRYPEGLAAALEKISGQAGAQPEVNKVLAPLYIVNPLADRAVLGLLSTHPPTQERIRILRSMAGAGFAAYQAAFQQIRGAGARCIGAQTLDADAGVAIRAPSPEPAAKEDAVERARQVGQLLDRVINFVVIPCACGVRLKVPPGFRRNSIVCPRCGREHAVPKAEAQPADQPLRYRRRSTGWESFQCRCGHTVQISPKFSAAQVKCPKCGRGIEVVSAAGQ